MTKHGGPHWVQRAKEESDVVALVCAHLSAPVRPPGVGWREA